VNRNNSSIDSRPVVTPEMIDAGLAELDSQGLLPVNECGYPIWSDRINRDLVTKVFRAMLAAAPRDS
jgi:hypothetical protein